MFFVKVHSLLKYLIGYCALKKLYTKASLVHTDISRLSKLTIVSACNPYCDRIFTYISGSVASADLKIR